MPIALLQYDPEKVPEAEVRYIAEHLPKIIAEHLSIPKTDGQLTAADVEVWANPNGLLDVNSKDLVVVVWAALYPERLENIDQRRRDLAMAIRWMFSKKWTGYVWILLQPQSFEEW